MFHVKKIQMNYQVLIFLKDNVQVFMNVVCCTRDWGFKGSAKLKPNMVFLPDGDFVKKL